MTDYISRKSVIVGLDYIINELNKLITDDSPDDGYTDIKNQVEEIKRGVLKLPPEDVQPVVHCKDCRWRMVSMDCTPFCSNDKPPVYAITDYFGCIYGKRKGADNG